MNRLFGIVWIAVLSAVVLEPSLARSQEENTIVEPDKPVDAKYVGIAGGAIAGGEVVVAGLAVFGVKRMWPYLTFPVLGAGAGGVGGYFLEKESPKGSVALLIGSMALIIPTAIAASAATAYDPEDETGVLVEPADEGPRFSFELDPQKKQPRQVPTTTEVEARPPPTLPDQDDAAQEPETESEPDQEPEFESEPGTEPEAVPESPFETEPEGESAALNHGSANSPARARTYVLSNPSRSSGWPSPRPASDDAVVGAVFNVGRDGLPRLGVPAVDLRPSSISQEEAVLGLKPALEIYLLLLNVDLP